MTLGEIVREGLGGRTVEIREANGYVYSAKINAVAIRDQKIVVALTKVVRRFEGESKPGSWKSIHGFPLTLKGTTPVQFSGRTLLMVLADGGRIYILPAGEEPQVEVREGEDE